MKEKIEITAGEIKNILENKIQVAGDLNISVYKRKVKIPDFIMLFQSSIAKMIIEDNLSPQAGKILWYLCSINAFGNTVAVRKTVISEKTHLSRTTVWRCITELIEREILQVAKDMNDARIDTYFINPILAWKGRPVERAKRLKALTNANQYKLPFNNTDFDKQKEISME